MINRQEYAEGARRSFFVTEQISPRIAKTPDGFLICYDVPIARTGSMIYTQAEADLMPWLNSIQFDSGGKLRVDRDAAEVFSEKSMASFEGKPITIDHPSEFVNPDNWSYLAKGTMQNIRRGEREQSDLLLSDWVITDVEAIQFVESGELRQVSMGYDAEYEQVAPGVARQKDIIGNHGALVQRGRAGMRCMIMDAAAVGVPVLVGRKRLYGNFSKTITASEINKMNREFWKQN